MLRSSPATLIAALLAMQLGVVACEPAATPPEEEAPTVPTQSDGYDAPIGSGPVFLADQFQLSQPGSGLDINGDGETDGIINEAWLPAIPIINQRFQASINSSRILIAMELTGLEQPYAGDDSSVTFKLYNCEDEDQDPSNNYCRDPGCARVLPKDHYIEDGQSRYRAQPAPIVAERYAGYIDEKFGIAMEGEEDLEVSGLHVEMTVPADLWELRDGVVCGVSSAADLHRVTLPLCEYQPGFCELSGVPDDLTIAEYLVLLHADPDIDMDADGIERFVLDEGARVAGCYDGDGAEIVGPDCLEDPRMADGYSICFDMHGIPATLVQ
jgi:hypothetical protein